MVSPRLWHSNTTPWSYRTLTLGAVRPPLSVTSSTNLPPILAMLSFSVRKKSMRWIYRVSSVAKVSQTRPCMETYPNLKEKMLIESSKRGDSRFWSLLMSLREAWTSRTSIWWSKYSRRTTPSLTSTVRGGQQGRANKAAAWLSSPRKQKDTSEAYKDRRKSNSKDCESSNT